MKILERCRSLFQRREARIFVSTMTDLLFRTLPTPDINSTAHDVKMTANYFHYVLEFPLHVTHACLMSINLLEKHQSNQKNVFC